MKTIVEEMSGFVLSSYVDSGVNICPHGPHNLHLVKDVYGIQVYRCALRGCLYFRHVHRSALRKFIEFFRELPKIPEVPEKGYYTIPYLAKQFGEDPRTIRAYYEVIRGLDINGQAKYFDLDDSTVVLYRDDAKPSSRNCSCRRRTAFTAVGAVAGAVIGAASGGKYGAKEAAIGALLGGIGGALLGYMVESFTCQTHGFQEVSHIWEPLLPPGRGIGFCSTGFRELDRSPT